MSIDVAANFGLTDESGETLQVQPWAGASGQVFTARAPGGYSVAVRANREAVQNLRNYLTAALGEPDPHARFKELEELRLDAVRGREAAIESANALIAERDSAAAAVVRVQSELSQAQRWNRELEEKLAAAGHELSIARSDIEALENGDEDEGLEEARRLTALAKAAEIKEGASTTDLMRLAAFILGNPDVIDGLVKPGIFGGYA